jgi:hypothetical protein
VLILLQYGLIKLKKILGNRSVHLHSADLGKVGPWRTPTGYEKSDNFSGCTDWLWNQGVRPDIVLIDGRFRVCSFLTSLVY